MKNYVNWPSVIISILKDRKLHRSELLKRNIKKRSLFNGSEVHLRFNFSATTLIIHFSLPFLYNKSQIEMKKNSFNKS